MFDSKKIEGKKIQMKSKGKKRVEENKKYIKNQ